MFELSKILWALVAPPRIAFCLLCLGIVLLFTRRWRTGRTLLAVLLASSIVLGTVPAGDWLLHRLEHRFPRIDGLPAKADGIILLGGEIDAARTLASGQPIMGRSARLLAFAELARRFPDARLVFTGGSGKLLDREANEAQAMPIALRAVGLDPARVIFEGRSRNTRENAVYTREIVEPKAGETWLLVTTASHMPRAVGVFRKAGFQISAYPVEFRTRDDFDWFFHFTFDSGFGDLSRPVKEVLGLLAYRILGYTDTLFPAP